MADLVHTAAGHQLTVARYDLTEQGRTVLDSGPAASRTAMPCGPDETVWIATRRRGITAHKLPAGPATVLPVFTDCRRAVRTEREGGVWSYGQTLTAGDAATQLEAAWCRNCNWSAS